MIFEMLLSKVLCDTVLKSSKLDFPVLLPNQNDGWDECRRYLREFDQEIDEEMRKIRILIQQYNSALSQQQGLIRLTCFVSALTFCSKA